MSFCGVWKLLWIHFIWSIIGCNQLIPRYAAFHIRAHLGERPMGSRPVPFFKTNQVVPSILAESQQKSLTFLNLLNCENKFVKAELM